MQRMHQKDTDLLVMGRKHEAQHREMKSHLIKGRERGKKNYNNMSDLKDSQLKRHSEEESFMKVWNIADKRDNVD